MRYTSIDQLEQFDLRDRYWELAFWDGQDLGICVEEPDILAGEHAGKRITKAHVTFRGIRMKETFTFEGETRCPMTTEEAIDQFAEGAIFVFSYDPALHNCEFCGLGAEKPLVMIFDFDTAAVQWDDFSEDSVGQGSVGELIQK